MIRSSLHLQKTTFVIKEADDEYLVVCLQKSCFLLTQINLLSCLCVGESGCESVCVRVCVCVCGVCVLNMRVCVFVF